MSGLNISFKISALDDFSNTMDNLSKKTKQAFETAGQLGTGMTAAGVGMAAGLGIAVKTASDFEAQISRVGAIAEATDSELSALRESAMQLGASTSKSAKEVALGQESLAALGMTANEIIASMPGVISAAEASGSDMAQTAEVMASALNIFNMEASQSTKVADVLAQTANQSAADLTDMQYALKYAGPPAAALGISLEELSASIGIMTNAGMGGEQAGTSLRGALISLLNPSEKNTKLMESMGIAVTDAKGNFVGLSGLVQNLSDSMSGMTDTQKAANLASIVGTEAVSGMLSLMKAGPAQIDKMTASLEASGGASAETAAKMKDNLKGALEQMGGAFETLSITVGTALTPAIKTVAEGITSMVNAFNALPSGVQTTIAVIAAVTALFLLLVGPLLILVAMIPAITTGFAAIAGAFGVTAGVLAGGIAIVSGVVVAIVALGAAFVIAYQKLDWFRTMVDTAWAWIKNAFNTALQFISGIVQSVMSAVTSFAGEQLAKFQALWNEHGTAIMTFVKNAFTGIQITISIAMAAIKAIFQAVWPIISNIVRVAWEYMKMIVGSAIDIVVGLIDAAMSVLKGDWSGAWDAIKGIAENIWHNIEGFFRNIDLVQIGKDIIAGLIRGIGSMGGAVMRSVSKIANSIPNGVKKLLGIHSPSRVLMELGGYTAEGLAVGIGKGISGIQSMAGAMANAATPNMGSQSLSYGLSGGGASGGSMSNTATAGNSTSSQPVVIQLTLPDGRVLAEASYNDMDQLFANKFSNELRVSGVKA
jgi:TP901 family phage tail tape measure protein